MPESSLPQSPAFQALSAHHVQAAQWHIAELMAADPQRAQRMSIEAAGVFLDYSKNCLTAETLNLLIDLATERGVIAQRQRMFGGERINRTEQRAVLHTALRAPPGTALMLDGEDVGMAVQAVLAQMRAFCARVHSGAWRGATGQRVTDVVNIGIGGSFLGPKMAVHALRPLAQPQLRCHFVSNVDACALQALLPQLDPATTLFIIASKTFTTAETMCNAHSARDWLVARLGAAAPAQHFVAVSTNHEGVAAFGIDVANMFGFWDWVGGRYSVWSAVGLVLMLAVGADAFDAFLAGAHAMDTHFCSAPLERNMPVILAAIGIWQRNFFGYGSLSIAPYWQDLEYLPGYLQQLDMESNGKQVATDGTALPVRSAPVIWGDVGTNGQHAYFQLLHQGTDVVPVDFITVLRPPQGADVHHTALLANCFAQSAALMRGKSADAVRAELQGQGMAEETIAALVAHKSFVGNRPSNTIVLPDMTPHALGALIALYEHKVFVQGVIWGINSFDQWGVELGKALARDVEAALGAAPGAPLDATLDASTAALVARARQAAGTALPSS